MAAKNRKELKENELVGAISDNFDSLRNHLPKIIIGIVALAVVVFGINYYLASRGAAKEAKSKNMVLFAVEDSAAGSVSTLDKQIEDHPDAPISAWAYLLKADSQLSIGLNRIFSDKATGKESISNAVKNFEKAVKNAGDDVELKQRALFGLGKSLESLGKFDEAEAKYSTVAEDYKGTPFEKLANIAIERVTDPSNRQFYTRFAARENNVFSAPFTETEVAPSTNTGLPDRPDFTYPGEEVVVGTEPALNDASQPKENPAISEPPKPNTPDSNANDKTKTEEPPKPPKDVLDEKAAAKTEPAKTEPAKTEPAKTEPAKTEPAKTEPAKTEPAKTEPAKTEPAKTEPAKTEPAKTEPAKTEPAKTEPAKTEPAKTEPAKTEPAKTEPAKTEPAKTEPAKTEPAKTEPAEPKKEEPNKDQ